MASPKIIYDFGANNGDDVAYYLLKADKVVAVEANAALCDVVRKRFAAEIAEGRLVVETCALTVQRSAEAAPFYLHKTNHVLSQFPTPPAEELDDFERIEVPSRNVVELIHQHGAPYYVKIDIEHYDHLILESLFRNGITPPYISAESHSIDVFAMLIVAGYRAFKLVDGQTVVRRYRNHTIATAAGPKPYSFPDHSAGPFGEDIGGPWMTKDNFFEVLSVVGLGWRDIHASRVDAPDPQHAPRVRYVVNRQIDY